MATLAMPYSCIPDRILDLGISPRAQSTFHALLSYRNRRTGLCNPRQKKLAERFSCHLRSVERAFAELRAAGMILAHRTLAGNRYELTTPEKWQPLDLAGAQPPNTVARTRHERRVERAISLYEPDVLEPNEAAAAAAGCVSTPVAAAAAATHPVGVTPETPSAAPAAPAVITRAEELVVELMPQHPEPGNSPGAVAEAVAILTKADDVDATVQTIREAHAVCRVEWASYPAGRFIPRLPKWLHDGDWKYRRPERMGAKSETWIERRERERKECDEKTYRMYAELGAWEILREYGDDDFVEAWRAKVKAVA